jgi:cytochrome c-type biogenesis protein CcsB
MAEFSQLLFSIATILLAIAFASHVGHAVLLANGRRTVPSLALATGGVARPAWAGVVTGSFATRAANGGATGSSGGTRLSAAASPLGRSAWWMTLVVTAILLASLAIRGYLVGRGPWGNMFEFSVAFGGSILAGYLVLERRYPIRSIGFIPVGVALALLLYAASLPSEIEPLLPALQNAPLLTIHVGMAVLSYGIFATAFAAGVGYLVQGKADRFAWLPSHKVLDEVAYRAVIIGFPIFATMIILGSWWASIAWSRYWGWDPKETAALVTWLTYAVYLHARNQRAWAGRPAALLLVVGFAMVLVTYSGSLWFSGLHAYSGL